MEKEISSPTFTIVNEYINENAQIYHFDLYRLKNLEDFFDIGGEEYLNKGICIFEWGEMLEQYLKKYSKITILKDENDINERKLVIEKY